MVTNGNQANGETGLNICTIGLKAEFNFLLSPIQIPIGIAIAAATKKPLVTVTKLVNIWSKKVSLPVYALIFTT